MVSDYEYENLFAEHFATNMIIVDSGATVEINAGVAPTVSDEEFLITNEEIQNESFKLSESLCSERNLVFGKMEASKLTFTFKNKSDYPTDLTGEEIDVYLYFDYDSSTLFKVGRYTINSDKYSDDRYTRSITAYDQIYYLKDLDITEWYNAYYEDGQRHMIGLAILNLFNWIRDPNDDYPNSPKIDIQIESGYSLCNGTFLLGKTIESDSITFEFYMQKLLEFNGAFGHINRQGNFEFVVMQWYDAEPVRTVTNDYRIPPTPFDTVSTWGIGGIDVYNADNIRKFTVRNTNKKKPSVYVIADSFVLADRDAGDADVEAALKRMHQVINHYNYKSCKTTCTGDLCVEVGDRINVNLIQDETEPLSWFRSYVLERTFSGIQGMTDVYQAKGDQKQPAYTVDNDNWHVGENSTSASGSGTGGVAVVDDENSKKFVEIIRNIGYRLLDEPDVNVVYNKTAGQVEINWEDPTDISTYNPVPVDWAGTIVIRKEGKPPIHRYGGQFGGTLLIDSSIRDEYKLTSYIDDTIQLNKKYYYGIFPYSIGLDDADHPIRHYRFTKIISVDTTREIVAPSILNIDMGDREVDVLCQIPSLESGTYSYIKLVAKEGSIPVNIADGDEVVDVEEPATQARTSEAVVTGLNENSIYYFVIFIEDNYGSTASSEPVQITTDSASYTDAIMGDAKHQLIDKIHEISPDIDEPGNMSYDSSTESYYFTQKTILVYEDVFTRQEIENANTIILEMEGKIQDSSTGNYSDFDIYIDNNDSFICTAIIANGSSDIPDSRHLFGCHEWNWAGYAPLDELNKDVFHKIRYKLLLNDSIPYKVECYVDGVLYKQTNISGVTTEFSGDYYSASIVTVDKSNLKNFKILIY